jgi:hypothetical protein
MAHWKVPLPFCYYMLQHPPILCQWDAVSWRSERNSFKVRIQLLMLSCLVLWSTHQRVDRIRC